MRQLLGLLYGRKPKFWGTFVKYGQRKSYAPSHPEPYITALLRDVWVKPKGEEAYEVTDHLWIRDALTLPPGLLSGQVIEFKGRVDCFPRGSHEVDFHVVDIEEAKLKERGKEDKAA